MPENFYVPTDESSGVVQVPYVHLVAPLADGQHPTTSTAGAPSFSPAEPLTFNDRNLGGQYAASSAASTPKGYATPPAENGAPDKTSPAPEQTQASPSYMDFDPVLMTLKYALLSFISEPARKHPAACVSRIFSTSSLHLTVSRTTLFTCPVCLSFACLHSATIGMVNILYPINYIPHQIQCQLLS
jgi:hypothetical protein